MLQIFHCLGESGEKYIHYILSQCSDYDYAETQRHINKYPAPGPVRHRTVLIKNEDGIFIKVG